MAELDIRAPHRAGDETEGPHQAVALLQAIVTAVPEWVAVVAADGRLVHVNATGCRMLEAAGQEVIEGTCIADRIAPEHRHVWRKYHERVCQGEHLIWDFDIIGLRGTRRHVEVHAAPIRLPDGTLAQVGITRELPERLNRVRALQSANDDLEHRIDERSRELSTALDRLKATERVFGLLVSSVTDYAIFMLDPTGRIISWNAGAERIKGYSAEEIIGCHFSAFYTEEDRATDVPGRGLRTAGQEGRFETEGWRLRKDGTRFWASVIIDAIYDGGQLVGFAKVTRDITERRAAEAQVRQSQKMEAIGQFTGGAAHDFNNLLMAIGSSLELLRKRLPDDQRMLALLDVAMQGVKRGTSITERMLAFARRQELKQEAVNLATLVSGMTELMERSIGPTIALETRLSPQLPRVHTDANQLETALLNLVLNARDAMPNGGRIMISGQAEAVGADDQTRLPSGRYVRFVVSDTGAGMDEATLARVTEPFFTTKGIGKGTGLGLSMVDGLVAQSKGKMVIRSELGRGTTIELWLPVAEGQVAASGEAPAEFRQTEATQRHLVVLVVDDDPLVLSNVADMLEDLGHTARAAASGRRALELLEDDPTIDLVITDQAMPGMTGTQLAEAIAAVRPRLPVILATGYAEWPAGGRVLPRLAKPFTQRGLAAAIAAT